MSGAQIVSDQFNVIWRECELCGEAIDQRLRLIALFPETCARKGLISSFPHTPVALKGCAAPGERPA
jgi:hypothetical protein